MHWNSGRSFPHHRSGNLWRAGYQPVSWFPDLRTWLWGFDWWSGTNCCRPRWLTELSAHSQSLWFLFHWPTRKNQNDVDQNLFQLKSPFLDERKKCLSSLYNFFGMKTSEEEYCELFNILLHFRKSAMIHSVNQFQHKLIWTIFIHVISIKICILLANLADICSKQ